MGFFNHAALFEAAIGGSVSVQLRNICLEYPYAQLEAATNGFHISRRLGGGSAGSVYLGEMPDGSEVAVKVIDLAALGADAAVAGFEEEIAVLSKFRHPNLVVLMGWARHGTRRFLIYEYLGGGDVQRRLNQSKSGKQLFPWHERLAAARDSATGLAHLHNATPHAFHRDIKTANILLGPAGAKMADFGLSCVAKTRVDKHAQCQYPSGTPGYTCPIYIQTGKVTEGSEVYSFGTVLLELLLNQLPAGMKGKLIVYPIQEAIRPDLPGAAQRCLAAVDRSAAWPAGLAAEMAQLALACTERDEARRPTFNAVCRSLRGLQEKFAAEKAAALAGVPGRDASPRKSFCMHPSLVASQMPKETPLGGIADSPSCAPRRRPLDGVRTPPRHGAGLDAGSFVMQEAPLLLAGAQQAQQQQQSASAQLAAQMQRHGGYGVTCQPAVQAHAAAVATPCRAATPNLLGCPVPAASGTQSLPLGAYQRQRTPVRRLSMPQVSSATTTGIAAAAAASNATASNTSAAKAPPGLRQDRSPRRQGCQASAAAVQCSSTSFEPSMSLAQPRPASSGSSSSSSSWRLECSFAAGLTVEELNALPTELRGIDFTVESGASAALGRQHQMNIFKTLLKQEKELLSYVSRNHLNLESIEGGWLKVSNASQNIALLNSQALRRGESAALKPGDTLSFAAQVELLQLSTAGSLSACGVAVEKTTSSPPGSGSSSTAPKEDGVPEKISISPFLTFRVHKVGCKA
eukprot:TRINITY_DN20887_c0_g1_i1.p1 TRINITY_DN20887_c0_g1~~TRINITY_DN20887_c0_g1_i1.p1  ORF type:complete len:744 (+),score=149.48 TRINITY_DN20887_c0_g1_i1:93-2324(+)